MSISVSDIRMGNKVSGSDNQELGVVNEVVNLPHPTQIGSGQPEHLFIAIAEGGFIEFWKGKLYVPFSAIASIDSEHNLILSCTGDEAKQKYSDKPAAFGSETDEG